MVSNKLLSLQFNHFSVLKVKCLMDVGSERKKIIDRGNEWGRFLCIDVFNCHPGVIRLEKTVSFYLCINYFRMGVP